MLSCVHILFAVSDDVQTVPYSVVWISDTRPMTLRKDSYNNNSLYTCLFLTRTVHSPLTFRAIKRYKCTMKVEQKRFHFSLDVVPAMSLRVTFATAHQWLCRAIFYQTWFLHGSARNTCLPHLGAELDTSPYPRNSHRGHYSGELLRVLSSSRHPDSEERCLTWYGALLKQSLQRRLVRGCEIFSVYHRRLHLEFIDDRVGW